MNYADGPLSRKWRLKYLAWTNPCVENRFQFLSYFSPFLDRFERYYPTFGKGAPSFNLLFHTSIVLFRIRNILLKIFPSKLPFLLPACTIVAFLISKWRIEKTRTATFPSIFTCPRYVRASWPVPLKNDIYISPPHSCWISLFHAYSSRARNWIFLGAAEAPAAKSGTKLFSLDERTLIAFIMLWCKTRVRNLSPAGFETSTPAPTSLVVRPFHRIFSSFHLYIRTIYILYTGNEDFLRRLWRCSGFFEDRHDHGGKYGWLASSDKRMWRVGRRGAVREERREREGRRDTYQFHLIQRFLAVCCSRYITNCFADPLEEPLAQRTEKILGLFIP